MLIALRSGWCALLLVEAAWAILTIGDDKIASAVLGTLALLPLLLTGPGVWRGRQRSLLLLSLLLLLYFVHAIVTLFAADAAQSSGLPQRFSSGNIFAMIELGLSLTSFVLAMMLARKPRH